MKVKYMPQLNIAIRANKTPGLNRAFIFLKSLKLIVERKSPRNIIKIAANCWGDMVSPRKIIERTTTTDVKEAAIVPTNGAFSILKASLKATNPTSKRSPNPIFKDSNERFRLDSNGRAKGI